MEFILSNPADVNMIELSTTVNSDLSFLKIAQYVHNYTLFPDRSKRSSVIRDSHSQLAYTPGG